MTAQLAHRRASAEVADLSSKFQAWEAGINEWVVERHREAKGVVIAALARAHHLQLGQPGTAKSYLVTTALSLIEGAKTMEVQLHGYSLMEDLYGPVSLKAMEEDRYLRKYETYLPWAHFVFADEIFKANPTLLNSNLWAFNERKYRHDGQIIDIPLISGFFASNEGPEDPTLQAFDDRIHLRYMVAPIREPSARLQMFRLRLRRHAEEKPAPVLTIDDIHTAHEYVDAVEVPDAVLEALNSLQEELALEQIRPTDRKFNDALRIIQATAVYNGRMKAVVDDMKLLSHMLWTNEKDRPVVAEKVMELANPIDKEATKLASDIEGLASQVEEVIAIEQKAIRVRRGVQLHNKMNEAHNELMELRARAKAEGLESEVAEEARKRLHSLTRRLLKKGFKVGQAPGEITEETLAGIIKDLREEDSDGQG